jgi:hypothetical protein
VTGINRLAGECLKQVDVKDVQTHFREGFLFNTARIVPFGAIHENEIEDIARED